MGNATLVSQIQDLKGSIEALRVMIWSIQQTLSPEDQARVLAHQTRTGEVMLKSIAAQGGSADMLDAMQRDLGNTASLLASKAAK